MLSSSHIYGNNSYSKAVRRRSSAEATWDAGHLEVFRGAPDEQPIWNLVNSSLTMRRHLNLRYMIKKISVITDSVRYPHGRSAKSTTMGTCYYQENPGISRQFHGKIRYIVQMKEETKSYEEITERRRRNSGFRYLLSDG